jgi:hypothetical protein
MDRESVEAVGGDSAEELVADGVEVKPGAVGLMEHEAVVGEVGADEEALFEHAVAVLAKNHGRAFIELHRAATPHRLRLALADFAADLDDGLDDVGLAFVEVHVFPTQAGRFASPHTGCGQCRPQTEETVVGGSRLFDERVD